MSQKLTEMSQSCLDGGVVKPKSRLREDDACPWEIKELIQSLEQKFTLITCNNKKVMQDYVSAVNSKIASLEEQLNLFAVNINIEKEEVVKELTSKIDQVFVCCDIKHDDLNQYSLSSRRKH